jgi:hypothetical protein
MALFRMLHRAAFICNICFLLAICLLWFKHPVNPGFASMILVMGFVLSIILNTVVNAGLIFLLVTKKTWKGIPRLLIYLNGGFLVIQLILLIK